MKIVYFIIVLATVSYSKPIDSSRSLDAPRSLKIKINDEPPSFDISWNKVDSVDQEDPVLGYKVKILQVKKVKKIVNKYNSDTQEVTTVETEEYPIINPHKLPEGNLTELIGKAIDHPKVRFEGWKAGVPYEIVIVAYTKNQDGPPSNHIRVRVHESK